jgi:AraC-like DNA-binding protein
LLARRQASGTWRKRPGIFEGECAIIRTYSTAHIAPAARLKYWNDIQRDIFMPMEVKPLDRASFEAELRFDALGSLGIARTMSRAARIDHSEKHVQQTAHRVASLIMPIRGPVTFYSYGREVALDEGDLGLIDSSAPSTVVLSCTNHALVLAIPYALLALHAPNPEAYFGWRMSGQRGLGHTLNAMVRSLWTQVEQGLPPHSGRQVTDSLLALVAAAYASEQKADVAESSLALARRAQIKRFIEAHLRDPGLSAVAIAAALDLSPRYVRMVFTAEHEHVSAYILRRRLDECAKQLGHPLWRGRSITETAFDWGFTNTAHFTRAFKQQFGVTPTCYRGARVASPAAVEAATP